MKSWAERVVVAEAKECGHYSGCGCEAFHGCCTHCPLPECVHDDIPTRGRIKGNAVRNMQIRELSQGGMPVHELAGRFSLSKRATFRVLARG